MILTGDEIVKRREKGEIVIDPFDSSLVNPNSYNLHLGDTLLSYTYEHLDMKEKQSYVEIKMPSSGFLLRPNKLYLAQTKEYTETYNLVPMLEGRSSVGRLGLFVHVTAGFGDIGFKGYWTLELSCVQPIRIYPDAPICQIYYHTVEGTIASVYGGARAKYQGNLGIQPSKLWEDFK